MLLDDEKATNEPLRLVCGAGRQMGAGKGTSESTGLVCGAGRQMGATNESTGLVSGAGRPIVGMDGTKTRNKGTNLV